MQPSAEKTVIVWGQDDVLLRAVEDLLDTRIGWKVIRISDDWDEATLSQAMGKLTPDVLILHEGIFARDMRPLLKLVHEYSMLKVIMISLDDNQMEIYKKQTICIRQASDLLAVIQNDADLNVQGGEK